MMTHFLKHWLVVLVSVGVGLKQSSALTDLSTYYNLMTALKYGETCSWTIEESRQNLTRDLSRLATRFSSSSLMTTMNRFSQDVVSNNKQFCSSPELLVCDKKSERCICGDPAKEVLFPRTNSSMDYVIEVDEAGVNRCRWNEGTYCFSDDITQSLGIKLSNAKCRSGTSCVAIADGQECSFRSLVFHVVRASGRRGGRPNIQNMMRDMYQGKVCTCQLDPTINDIDWDEDDITSNDIRRKREILPELEIRNEELASFVSPVFKIQSLFA